MKNLFNKTISFKSLIANQDHGTVKYTTCFDYEDVPCRIQQYTFKDDVRGGRQKSGLSYVVYCENIDITQKHIAVIGGEDYNIISITKEGNFELYLKILVEQNV